jgi:hypothetical protein
MIGNAQKQMDGLSRTERTPRERLQEVRRQPAIQTPPAELADAQPQPQGQHEDKKNDDHRQGMGLRL